MIRKDIINFAGGFVFGVVLLYVLVQSTLQQCLHVADKAYGLSVEMENQLIELRSYQKKGDLRIPKKENQGSQI
tara:strand:- start:235 stop:456 length:222 start_codon:yes stop_codon:yes gene_type:complete